MNFFTFGKDKVRSGEKYGPYKYKVGGDVVVIEHPSGKKIVFEASIHDSDVLVMSKPQYQETNSQSSNVADSGRARRNEQSVGTSVADAASDFGISIVDFVRVFTQAKKVYKAWKLGKIKGDPRL
jgi:hypothetical protein